MTIEQTPKLILFMTMLGCRPPGRLTEQHDIFFGIASDISDLVPAIKKSWPEVKGNIHLDAWRKVTNVDGFSIDVEARQKDVIATDVSIYKLFFINLGGYKPDEFDELHHKILVVAPDRTAAISKAKQSAFYKQNGFKGAASHLDEKYGFDIDDAFEIQDLLSEAEKLNYQLVIRPAADETIDKIHLGYMQLHRLHLPSE